MPSDAIRRQWSWSTLAQVMVLSHHMIKSWLIICVKDTYQCKILLVWMMDWRLINAKPSPNATVGYIHFPVINILSYPSGLGYLDYYDYWWFNFWCSVLFLYDYFCILWNIHLTHARCCSCRHSLSCVVFMPSSGVGLVVCPHQSVRCGGSYLRPISQAMLKISIIDTCLKITDLSIQRHPRCQ